MQEINHHPVWYLVIQEVGSTSPFRVEYHIIRLMPAILWGDQVAELTQHLELALTPLIYNQKLKLQGHPGQTGDIRYNIPTAGPAAIMTQVGMTQVWC